MVEPHSPNFRVITTNFLGVQIFRKFMACNSVNNENYCNDPRGAVWSGSTLFAILSASFRRITVWKIHMSCIMRKPIKWHVCPAKTLICLGICSGWSESSLSARRNLGSLATHWAHTEDSEQTRQVPTSIWVFAGRTLILLVCHVGAHISWIL